MGLIAEDAAITVRIGDRFVGAAAVFTDAAFDFMAMCKEVDYTDETEKTNVQGAGSARKKHRYHSDAATMTLKGVTPTNGILFGAATGSISPVRKNVQVVIHPNSTLQTTRTFNGVITKWNPSMSQGEAQMESIEIDLDPDYPPAS